MIRIHKRLSQQHRPRVVIVGGGFAGIRAARSLQRAPVDVVLIDRRNFHLFQPLTYQIATGALPPTDVAYPLRSLFRDALNVEVQLAEVTEFDVGARAVIVDDLGPEGRSGRRVQYDTLIVAAGSAYSYFGRDDFARYAPEVKSLENAITVRSRILRAFELAEAAGVSGQTPGALSFVIVGGGPTGVEMAGQIAELARRTLRREFRHIDPAAARVILVDSGSRLLRGFPQSLSVKAQRSLERMGVIVELNQRVQDIDDAGVETVRNGETSRIPARTVIWAAGVEASSLARRLGALAGIETDAKGRLTVGPDLTLPGHPEVIAVGDMVRVADAAGEPLALPGLAPVAIQQGQYAARLVKDRLAGRHTRDFHYRNKGNIATIGRAKAVADLRVVKLSGFPAWMTWLVVHLWYLNGRRNRLFVIAEWAVSYFTGGRGALLIDDDFGPVPAAGARDVRAGRPVDPQPLSDTGT